MDQRLQGDQNGPNQGDGGGLGERGRQSRADRAEPLFLRALAIREKVLSPEDANIATSLSNLAGLYQDRGDYDRAERWLVAHDGRLELLLSPEDFWAEDRAGEPAFGAGARLRAQEGPHDPR